MKFICKSCAALLSGALFMAPVTSPMAFAAQAISVGNAWVGATAPGQKTAGAYMELTSGADGALMAVESPVAWKAELHSMSMDAGVMRMRQVQKIDLPAQQKVKLMPGGLHVMLIDIKQPLKAGDKVPLTLTIRGSGYTQSTLKVEAEVRAMGGAAMHGH